MKPFILLLVWIVSNILMFGGNFIDFEIAANLGKFALWIIALLALLGSVLPEENFREVVESSMKVKLWRRILSWGVIGASIINAVIWGYFVLATIFTIALFIGEARGKAMRDKIKEEQEKLINT